MRITSWYTPGAPVCMRLRNYIYLPVYGSSTMGMTEGWVRGAGMLLLALLLLCCTVPFVTAGPATDEDWYREGNNWTNQKRYDLAIQAYDQALALNPGYARAYFARGQALASLGMHRDALEAFDEAILRDPGIAGVVASYLQTSERVVYPDVRSGSLIRGYWVSGWRWLEIDNRRGVTDIVVALSPRNSQGVTTAVYVKKGYYHLFEGVVPPGGYDFYITYGERWNPGEKQFDRNAGYLQWTTPYSFDGASGSGYSMTFIPQAPHANWYTYSLVPVPETGFPLL